MGLMARESIWDHILAHANTSSGTNLVGLDLDFEASKRCTK